MTRRVCSFVSDSLACHADVLRETTGDLRDRELRGHDDRLNAFDVSTAVVKHHVELSFLLECGEVSPGVMLESQAGRLKNARNRGADDVLAVLGKIDVTVGRYPGEAIAFVAIKSDLEHGATRRYGSVILVILTSAKGWRWPLSLRTRFFGL